MSFISKTCQIVAGTNMIHQFHEIFKFVFGGFLQFGPALRRTCHSIEVSSLRKTRAVLAASAAAAFTTALCSLSQLLRFCALSRAAAAAAAAQRAEFAKKVHKPACIGL